MTKYTKNKQFITWDTMSLDLFSWSPQQSSLYDRRNLQGSDHEKGDSGDQ